MEKLLNMIDSEENKNIIINMYKNHKMTTKKYNKIFKLFYKPFNLLCFDEMDNIYSY